MENKQTAVDYLLTQISARIDIIKPNAIEVALLQDVYYKAKAMEKQQIEKAYESGCIGEVFELNCNHSSEQYYKETYG